ncbi:MAG: hypothetical protein H9789_12550, partial [Candidatus Paraprevotella stercoravium]|nr:hypothetical protein [Candidatus Paraprevotella stercoravium]
KFFSLRKIEGEPKDGFSDLEVHLYFLFWLVIHPFASILLTNNPFSDIIFLNLHEDLLYF